MRRLPTMLDVVEEHFDEAEFLWEHRAANLFTPDWTLADLAGHDARLEAHLDGLRVAGVAAQRIALDRFEGDDAFSTAVASKLLLERGEGPRERVFEVLAGEEEPVAQGAREALRFTPLDADEERLRGLSLSDDARAAVRAADVLAFQRRPVRLHEAWLVAEDAEVRRLAVGVAGRTAALSVESIERALEDAEPVIRHLALLEACRQGTSGLADLCRRRAARGTDPDPMCVRLLGLVGTEDDMKLLESSLERPELALEAVEAFGIAGYTASVPRLINLMEDDDLGRAAVRSYVRITGADDVEGHLPIPRETDAEDESIDELPPNPDKARHDWRRREAAMTAEGRWQYGTRLGQDVGSLRPLTLDARRDAYMRIRSADAGGTPDVELEDLALRQS